MVFVNDIGSYISMFYLNMYLCFAATVVAMFVNMLYQDDDTTDNYANFSRWFRFSCTLVVFFALSCIFNQLASAFACRSITILFNFRFTSMLIVQILGFMICLLFAFLLGIKYALLNHLEP